MIVDVAEEPGGARLVDARACEDLVLGQVLAADVDEDVLRLDRVRGDQAALDAAGAGRVAMTSRSLNAPGSDSSALTTRYFGFAALRSISERLAAGREAGAAAAAELRGRAARRSAASGRHARAPSAARRSRRSPRYSASFVRSRSSAPARSDATSRPRELLHDRGDVLGLHVLAVAVVDGDDGRVAAAAEALDRRGSVTSPSSVVSPARHAELLLERLDDPLRADERAREVRADLDQVLADRLEVEHVVEGRDRVAVRRASGRARRRPRGSPPARASRTRSCASRSAGSDRRARALRVLRRGPPGSRS